MPETEAEGLPPEEMVAALARPGAWPADSLEPGAAPEIIQTHISMLFLLRDRVVKVKKAVDLGFLDFTRREERRRLCQEEVRLNRRLAPEVYLGVAPIFGSGSGDLRLGPMENLADGRCASIAGMSPVASVGPDESIVDWGVVMRRLPADRMLESLLERGEVTDDVVDRLASKIAAFHDSAARGPHVDEMGGYATVAYNVRENFEQLRPFIGEVHPPELHAFLERRAEAALADRRETFAERERTGRICEGHGDLHASNVCVLEDGLAIYDCIEFNERFRCADVAADLAFLAMDLDHRGEAALARRLAQRYVEHSGDTTLPEVLDFYCAYRAIVRGKVAAITSRESEIPADVRAAKRREARRYLELAARYELGPALVLTCGLPASGKSYFARELARRLGADLLRSDVRRKELAGLAPSERVQPGYGRGLYSPEMKRRTYGSLLSSAEDALRSGRSVVVDAAFSLATERQRFEAAAAELGRPGFVVHVTATEAQTRARLAARAEDPTEPSDADLDVWRHATETFEAPEEPTLRVESETRPLDVEISAFFERWIVREVSRPRR